MRMLLQIIGIFLLGYLAEMFLPWYSIAFIAAMFGYLLKTNANFIAGLLAIALLWGFQIWLIDPTPTADLAARVALIFPVKEKWILIFATLLIGGLVGGFSCLTGALLRRQERTYYY